MKKNKNKNKKEDRKDTNAMNRKAHGTMPEKTPSNKSQNLTGIYIEQRSKSNKTKTNPRPRQRHYVVYAISTNSVYYAYVFVQVIGVMVRVS
jgi:hypothetical protein